MKGDESTAAAPARLLLHHRFQSLLHFFHYRLRLVCADHPRVAIWIDDVAAAVTLEHVHHRTQRSHPEFGRFSTTLSTFST